MKKMIFLAIAGYVWKKIQGRYLGRSTVPVRRGY